MPGGSYYNLPSAKIADQLTPLEKALRSIPIEQSTLSLRILEKLLKNISQNPKEMKFRRIKLRGQAKPIRDGITSVQGALMSLIQIGFKVERKSDNPELGDTDIDLVLDLSILITFPTHVNTIIDANDFFRKENEKLRVAKGLGRVAPIDEKVEEVRSEEQIVAACEANCKWIVGGS